MIHILHLENNPADALLISETLAAADLACRITPIQTETELAPFLEQHRPHIILADFSPADGDGLSSLRLVRTKHPDIPFIFVSRARGEEAVIEALTHGATDYVLKENLARLAPAVTRALQGAQDLRQDNQGFISFAESKAQIHSILESTDIGVALISPRMEILELNPRMRQWFPNVDPSQHPICYQSFNRPPRHEVCSYCPTCKTLKDGRVYEATTQTSQDGGIRNYRILSLPLYNTAGEIVAAIETVEDITEHKLADETRQQSNDLLRAIIEAAPVAIIGLDLDGCVHTVWNPAAEKMLGWSAKEIMGQPLPTVDQNHQEEFRHFREMIRDGLTLDGVEVQRQRRDGSPIDYSIYASPLHDASGNINGNIAVLVDITERKRAEEKMLHSEQRLRLHREHSPLGFLEWDENFCAVEWNAACERIFGYSREEALGRHARELILPAEVHDLVDEIFHSLMQQIGGRHSVNKNVTKDGRTIICEWFNTTLVNKNGEATGVASVCNDITEQKQMEAELVRYRDHLEEEVKKRTSELEEKNRQLERMNQLFVGRELRMIELKERIKALEDRSRGK